MKILKIFGIVVGIHVFALLLIFAIPGCSSTTKPAPQPADTVAKPDAPMITVPNMAASAAAAADPAPAAASSIPPGFNPDAPATYGEGSSGASGGVHFTPTRPNSPAASALMAPAVTDVTPAATYSVRSGDSLWTIAKKNHIPVSELATANSLRTTAVLHEGQKLIIPGKAAAPAAASRLSSSTPAASSAAAKTYAGDAMAASAPKGSGEDLKHVVKAGESLGTIAKKYGVRAKDIAVRNNIADPQKLRAGTELVIPGWRSTAKGSAAKAAAASSEAPAKSAPPMIGVESSPASGATDAQPTPSTSAQSSVPVIQIDENPISPAPKS